MKISPLLGLRMPLWAWKLGVYEGGDEVPQAKLKFARDRRLCFSGMSGGMAGAIQAHFGIRK